MILKSLRDWWRGYSDADVISVGEKIENGRREAGSYIVVTDRELRAVPEYQRMGAH